MNNFIQNKKYFYKKIKFPILTGILFLSVGLHAQYGEKTVDSLKAVLCKPTVTDNELFYIYEKLTDAYVTTNTEKSLDYARMGIRLAEKKNDLYQIANFYYNTGIAYLYAGRQDSAGYFYKQALDVQKQAMKDESYDPQKIDYLQMFLFKAVGMIDATSGKYDSSLDNYFNALALAEKMKNYKEIILINGRIATIYYGMSNFQQAEAYYLKGEQLCRKANDSIGLVDAYRGLCSIFLEKKEYSEALSYGEKSYRILSALPNVSPDVMMNVNQQLTDVWLQIPDYDKAMEYAKKTVEYANQTGSSSYMATALYMLSSCYLKQGKYRESEETAFQALATDSTNVYINFVLYGNIAQANIWLGNHAKGIEYFRKTTNAIRAYSNKNFQSSLSEMEVKYETEKKELKIAALGKEKRLITGLSIAGGAILLLALATFILLWRWMVQKKRVAEKQQQLAEQQIKQLEQEKQLVATQAVLDGETQERTRLARDLHDGLGSMLTGVKMKLLEMKKGVKLEHQDLERFDKALGLLDNSVQEMRRVAHHLMPVSLSRFGLKPAVNDFCRSFTPTVVFNYFGDETRLDSMMEVVIYRSIHELVNNAIKYSGASQILVQIMQEPNRIAFTVQDDGCGFDPSVETQGTGLQNIRNRIASFGGNIQIDSKAGEGTEVNGELRIES